MGPVPRRLTERQIQIVELVARGNTNREIGAELGIRPATVKRHLERIYDQVGMRTRAGAATTVLLAREREQHLEQLR